jgi:hypothetical protein
MTSLPHSHPAPPSAMPVWLVGGAGVPVILALFAAGSGSLLRLAIPAVAAALGLALYLRRPIWYLQFTLWTWFLTPLVRRLVDYRCGFVDQNLVLLAPFLVSAIAGLTLFRERNNVAPARVAPFYLCMAAILYGFCVGMIRWKLGAPDAVSPGEVIYGLFNWLAPLLFGLHLYLRAARDEGQTFAGIQSTVVWATIFMGCYGVYQYVAPPAWDSFWLESLPGGLEVSTFGRPNPYEVRVWSTMNAPGPFAAALTACLMMLIAVRSRLKYLALTAGSVALFLSLSRSAWLGCAIALLFCKQLLSTGARNLIVLTTLLVVPAFLVSQTQSASPFVERITSIFHPEKDESAQARWETHALLLPEVLSNPSGIGLNNLSTYKQHALDSGPIRMLLSLGQPGTLLFAVGLTIALLPLFGKTNDIPLIVCRALVVSYLAQLLSNSTFVGSTGAMFWLCLGLGLSAVGAKASSESSSVPSLASATVPR